MIALTHAHPDHWGAAPRLRAQFGAEVAVHEADAGIVTGAKLAGSHLAFRMGKHFLEAGTCGEVVRLNEGDRVGDFTVVHAPGHSAGHVIYYRESDGVAVTGDLFSTMDVWTRRRRLAEPPEPLSLDPEENRRSILKLAAMRPSLVLPGHGAPLKDMGRLEEFAERIRERAGSTAA